MRMLGEPRGPGRLVALFFFEQVYLMPSWQGRTWMTICICCRALSALASRRPRGGKRCMSSHAHARGAPRSKQAGGLLFFMRMCLLPTWQGRSWIATCVSSRAALLPGAVCTTPSA